MNNNSNRNNSNSSNNNRRRGRNTNRSGGGGGGAVQGNRIDSRSRGNAPQMLEKYRKLAHDASLNDDRVLTEYYLQFADHYFRVMADMKAQKDEQALRGGRSERGPDEDSDLGPEDEFEARTRQYQPQNQPQHQPQRQQQPQRQHRSDADDVSEGMEGEPDDGANPFSPERRPERARRPERSEQRGPRPDRSGRTERPDRAERPERTERPESQERPARVERADPDEAREPTEARVVREPRAPRKPAVRRSQPRDDDDGAAPALLDASILPPAIARADVEVDAGAEDAAPVRKPLRVRTKRPPISDSDEALEAIG